MKRLVAALVVTAVLSAPAYAQFSLGGGQDSAKTRYSEEEKRNEAATERAYKDAIRNTRGATVEAYDPWRNIRPATPDKNEKKR